MSGDGTSQEQARATENGERPFESAPTPPFATAQLRCARVAGAGVQESKKRQRLPAPGPTSQCERFREAIAAKVEAGLSAVRIFQAAKGDRREWHELNT